MINPQSVNGHARGLIRALSFDGLSGRAFEGRTQTGYIVRRFERESRVENNLPPRANAAVVGEICRVGAAAMVGVGFRTIAVWRKIYVHGGGCSIRMNFTEVSRKGGNFSAMAYRGRRFR